MLAHSVVTADSSEPVQYMLFLHGILGTRANWRSVARQFVKARPEWGAILVDLREHGDSLGHPAPHTVKAAASDVAELEQSLAYPIEGALGHSFGGKVVLEWLELRGERAAEAWLVDSCPGPSPVDKDSTATAVILDILDRLPQIWPSREAFIDAIVDAGQPVPIAQWLAMNLRRIGDGTTTFGPDLDAIRSLIADYARADLWPTVESPPASWTLQVVIGGQSAVFSRADRSRMEQLAARNPRLFVHVIEQAGHWVHIEATDALVSLLTSAVGLRR